MSLDFLDTNVLLYLLSADQVKAQQTQALLAKRAVISVQVLNEFANVAKRKLNMPVAEIQAILQDIRHFCQVLPLSLATHESGLVLCERYNFALYDAMIVASSLEAKSAVLWSEDFQHGLQVNEKLTINNPFL